MLFLGRERGRAFGLFGANIGISPDERLPDRVPIEASTFPIWNGASSLERSDEFRCGREREFTLAADDLVSGVSPDAAVRAIRRHRSRAVFQSRIAPRPRPGT